MEIVSEFIRLSSELTTDRSRSRRFSSWFHGASRLPNDGVQKPAIISGNREIRRMYEINATSLGLLGTRVVGLRVTKNYGRLLWNRPVAGGCAISPLLIFAFPLSSFFFLYD